MTRHGPGGSGMTVERWKGKLPSIVLPGASVGVVPGPSLPAHPATAAAAASITIQFRMKSPYRERNDSHTPACWVNRARTRRFQKSRLA